MKASFACATTALLRSKSDQWVCVTLDLWRVEHGSRVKRRPKGIAFPDAAHLERWGNSVPGSVVEYFLSSLPNTARSPSNRHSSTTQIEEEGGWFSCMAFPCLLPTFPTRGLQLSVNPAVVRRAYWVEPILIEISINFFLSHTHTHTHRYTHPDEQTDKHTPAHTQSYFHPGITTGSPVAFTNPKRKGRWGAGRGQPKRQRHDVLSGTFDWFFLLSLGNGSILFPPPMGSLFDSLSHNWSLIWFRFRFFFSSSSLSLLSRLRLTMKSTRPSVPPKAKNNAARRTHRKAPV